jgi:hypothetical protein
VNVGSPRKLSQLPKRIMKRKKKLNW